MGSTQSGCCTAIFAGKPTETQRVGPKPVIIRGGGLLDDGGFQQAPNGQNKEPSAQDKKEQLEQVQEFLDLHHGMFPQVLYTNILKNDYEVDESTTSTRLDLIEVRDCVNKKSNIKGQMKIIKKSLLNLDACKAIVNEIQILQELDHPNLMKIHDTYQDKSNIYIVEEQFHGRELFDVIQKKSKLDEHEVLKIIYAVMQAVTYCHSQNIVHRDVKPESILLQVYENELQGVKLVDFGHAAVAGKDTMLKELIGTPYYQAPEMIKRNYGPKCDIWSCGVILHLLLLGKPPFDGANAKMIKVRILNQDLDWKKFEYNMVSPEAKDLIRKCLISDFHKRPSGQQILQHTSFHDLQARFANSKIAKEININALMNLKLFNKRLQTQRAIMQFIQGCLVTEKEKETMRTVFQTIDKNHDFKLTKNEFQEGLSKMGLADASQAANQIFSLVDTDGSGSIQFSEFCTATMDQQKLLHEEKLATAFKMLDIDGDGEITFPELCRVMSKNGQSHSKQELRDIFNELDINGDGKVTYNEFEQIMNMVRNGGGNRQGIAKYPTTPSTAKSLAGLGSASPSRNNGIGQPVAAQTAGLASNSMNRNSLHLRNKQGSRNSVQLSTQPSPRNSLTKPRT